MPQSRPAENKITNVGGQICWSGTLSHPQLACADWHTHAYAHTHIRAHTHTRARITRDAANEFITSSARNLVITEFKPRAATVRLVCREIRAPSHVGARRNGISQRTETRPQTMSLREERSPHARSATRWRHYRMPDASLYSLPVSVKNSSSFHVSVSNVGRDSSSFFQHSSMIS